MSQTQTTVEQLRTLLGVLKNLPKQKVDEQFFKLMKKATNAFGQNSYQIAQFYYEYGSYMLDKIDSENDIFNTDAIPNNIQQEQQQILQQICEEFEDSQSQQSNNNQQNEQKEAQNEKNEKNEKTEKQQQNQKNEQNQKKEQKQQKQQYNNDLQQDQQSAQDDKTICLINLEQANRIYKEQLIKLQKGETKVQYQQLSKWLRRSYTRLGDYFMSCQNYPQAVDKYRMAIKILKQQPGWRQERLLAELHYLIGVCFLNQNKQGCQKIALQQFCATVNILLANLSVIQGYDVSKMTLPTPTVHVVERYPFLIQPFDSQKVKQLKQTIMMTLDKIQDTYSQAEVTRLYKKQKQKAVQQKKASQFKQVPSDAKVVNLGKFGNRKKLAQDTQDLKQKLQQIKKNDEPSKEQK